MLMHMLDRCILRRAASIDALVWAASFMHERIDPKAVDNHFDDLIEAMTKHLRLGTDEMAVPAAQAILTTECSNTCSLT